MDMSLPVSSLLCHGRRKRPHDQISTDSRVSPCLHIDDDSSSYFPQRASRPPSSVNGFHVDDIRMPSSRFRGDGLDMRRPVMTTNPPQQDVIDLTNDSPIMSNGIVTLNSHGRVEAGLSRQHSPSRSNSVRRPRGPRGPRFDRSIINPVDVSVADNTIDLRESSPEVQFVREQPRSRSRSTHGGRPQNTTQHGGFDQIGPFLNSRTFTFGTGGSEDDNNTAQPTQLTRFFPRFPPGFPFTGRDNNSQDRRGNTWGGDELFAINDIETRDFDPFNMDVTMQGFNLQNPSQPVQQNQAQAQAARAPPTYEKPPPARPGFTRDLDPGVELGCVNCDDELGVGETELKRQVWVIKACGHVYCGECAKNRIVHENCNSVKEDQVGKPFKTCLVEDCKSKLQSIKAFLQIYL